MCDYIGTVVADNPFVFGGARDYFLLKNTKNIIADACLSFKEVDKYLDGSDGFGWHISDLVIYDKPKELREFKKINRECFYADLGLAKRDCPKCQNANCMITRPPQSWCYCEEVEK